MLGLANMREQSFLTVAIQNMKRIVKAFMFSLFAGVFVPLVITIPRRSRGFAICGHSPGILAAP